MEPVITTIVTAIASGAVAAAKDVATSAIKDAYQGLKNLISGKYKHSEDAVAAVEARPESQKELTELATSLEKQDAAGDSDLKTDAQKLLDEIDKLKDDPKAAPLFDFDRLRVARDLKLSNIEVIGTLFRGKDVNVEQDFIVDNVHQTGDPKKK